MPGDPRTTTRWRKLRTQVLSNQPECQLRLAGCTIVATTVDHIHPLRLRPDLAYEVSNLQAACHHCNSSDGAAMGNRLRGGRADDRWLI